MTHLFLRKLLLSLVLISLFSCTTDDETPEKPLLERTLNYKTANQIPEIIEKLSANLGSDFFNNQQATLNPDDENSTLEIDLDKILEVIDTLKNTNYTFLVKDDDNNPFTFTNLIVKKDRDGNIGKPYFQDYILDEDYTRQFIDSGFSMENFTGRVRRRYVRSNFLDIKQKAAANLEQKLTIQTNSDCPDDIYYGGSTGGSDPNFPNPNPDFPGGPPASGGTLTICISYLQTIEGDACDPELHQLLEYTQGSLDGHVCDENKTILVTRCETLNKSTANTDSNCPSEESEDIGILSNAMQEYIEGIAKDLPPDLFLDPARFWEFLWQNGYINPFGAGIVDGALESARNIWEMGEIMAAWNYGNLTHFYSPQARMIRNDTYKVFELIRELVTSPQARQQFKSAITSEFNAYIDLIAGVNNEALHAQGKLLFDVATLFIGYGEINALLKGTRLSTSLIKALKLLPDEIGTVLVKARKWLDSEAVDISIRKSKDALNDPNSAIDAIQTSEITNPNWTEIKALWKRGNDFNKKGYLNYEYNEIYLDNGKRLDSYIPGQKIVSRKATTLSQIQVSTFEKYLKEFTLKYKKGTIITSRKYELELNGSTLQGDYVLEIPEFNKFYFENNPTLQSLANQYNVKIEYLDEF